MPKGGPGETTDFIFHACFFLRAFLDLNLDFFFFKWVRQVTSTA